MRNVLENLKTKAEKDYGTVKEYIEFLNRFEWDFMVTFTSGENMSLNRACSKIERLSNYLFQKQPDIFKIFWVAEPHQSGYYHIHALIITKDAKASVIKSAWNKFSGTYEKTNNRCDIKKYEKGKGGNVYTVKNLMKDNVEHGFIL